MTRPEMSSRQFAESLPDEYRARFDPSQIAAHAHTAAGHGPGRVAARRFPWHGPGVTGLCVVADDQPGLLSLISSAFAELGFEVDAAEAYTRHVDPPQAVDVFWVRDPERRLNEARIQAFAELVEEIIAGKRAAVRRAPRATTAPAGTTVRFIEDSQGHLSVLEIETDDRSGLLWAITHALFELDVQIVASRIHTIEGRVHDRFTIVELDGSPISSERRLAIQVALMTAIQPQLSTSAAATPP